MVNPMAKVRQDPYAKLLLPTKHFSEQDQYASYLHALTSALSWVDQESCSVVIADASVNDCPVVAVSDTFLNETGYPRSKVLYTNTRFLVDNVSGSNRFRISKSLKQALESYCDLARFPGAVNSSNAMTTSQPNALYDGTVVNSHFTVLRTFVAGHPFLIGVPTFSTLEQSTGPEGEDSHLPEREECLQRMSMLLLGDEALAKVLGYKRRTKVCAARSQGLYYGPQSSPYTLFYNQGFSVLRQEPQVLSHSGVIVTSEPLKRSTLGHLEYSLMVETLTDWTGDWPMGFTKTPPGSNFPKRLHFSAEHVGFTMMGVVCNCSKETIPATQAGMAELQRWPVEPLPDLRVGDVVTVRLHESGDLSRYLNGQLICTVATGMKPEGAWYGAFEVSMSVSSVTMLLDKDLFPTQAEVMNGRLGSNQFGSNRSTSTTKSTSTTYSITSGTTEASAPNSPKSPANEHNPQSF